MLASSLVLQPGIYRDKAAGRLEPHLSSGCASHLQQRFTLYGVAHHTPSYLDWKKLFFPRPTIMMSYKARSANLACGHSALLHRQRSSGMRNIPHAKRPAHTCGGVSK